MRSAGVIDKDDVQGQRGWQSCCDWQSRLIRSRKKTKPTRSTKTKTPTMLTWVQKGNRRGCDVFTFRIPPLSGETGESMRIHFYNFCIASLCLQKTSETIWPAQLRDTITTVIVSRGGLQKGNRRGYDVYTFRIPSQCHEKGEPLRIHFYSFCIPSRLKDKYEMVFFRPNFVTQLPRDLCHTRLSSKKHQKRIRVLQLSYPCTVWWKRGKRCGFTFTLWVSTLCLQKVIPSILLEEF